MDGAKVGGVKTALYRMCPQLLGALTRRFVLKRAQRGGMGETDFVFEDGRVRPKVGVPLVQRTLSAFRVALARGNLGVLVERPVTKDFDRFLGRDFTARDPLMHRLRLRRRHITLVLEVTDDPRGIARFFSGGPGVFGGLAHDRHYIPAGKSRHCTATT